jgi:DNA-binding protein HU-beta
MSPQKAAAPPAKPNKKVSSSKETTPATKKSAALAKSAATVKKAAPAKKAAPVKAGAVKAGAVKAGAVKAGAVKAGATTVTLKQIAAELAEGHDLPKKQAEAVLGDLITLTTRHLKQGDKIRLNGLGIFSIQMRQARTGRNPATGEAIQIKASKKIAFRPAKELKEAV